MEGLSFDRPPTHPLQNAECSGLGRATGRRTRVRAGERPAQTRLRGVRVPARGGGGSETRPRRSVPCFCSRRAGSVQTHGAFAVFGQLVGMQGSQTGLPKQNDGAREGERMRERMSGAERGLQAARGRSSKNKI
jgi:hypothetical protein